MLDNMTILIALTTSVLVLTFIILVRQMLTGSANKVAQKLEEQFLQLVKQTQQDDQQLREHVIVNIGHLQQSLMEKLGQNRLEQNDHSANLKEQLQGSFANHRARFDERQMDALKILQDTLQKGVTDNRQQLKEALSDHATELSKRVEALTQTTETKLKEINHQVEKRLSEGFEKTNETFGDIIKRLAMIDAAQQKITELSNNVMSLQDILNDKRSRGAFGEVQLSALIHNMIPEQHFSFQHLLSNHKRPDCMLFLPEPTGNIAVDAKFPLENYRTMIDSTQSDAIQQQAERQFKIDIKKHIQDIAEKYIIPGETADGAVMFIPAEAVFAQIHAHHSDLVDFAHKSKVWLVSPTTMMAILTTARAVLKDAATRKQVHEIQQHLRLLADDFERFQMRMDNLAKRIAQAHSDVEQVHISSRKITQRFIHIEKADFDSLKMDGPVLVPKVPAAAVAETQLTLDS